MSLEIYTKFSENKTFETQSLNGFLDHFYTLMISQLGNQTVMRDVYIDGAVAQTLQGALPKIYNLDMAVRSTETLSVARQQLKEMFWAERKESEGKIILKIMEMPVVISIADYPVVIINGVPVRALNSFN